MGLHTSFEDMQIRESNYNLLFYMGIKKQNTVFLQLWKQNCFPSANETTLFWQEKLSNSECFFECDMI